MDITIYTDGGSRGNPGHAAIGYLVFENDTLLYKHATYIGIASNNVAEYTALIRALISVKSHNSVLSSITCYADSELMVKQLKGEYKVKHPDIRPLYNHIKQLEMELGLVPRYVHVVREKNKQADALVNQALDAQEKE